VLVGWGVLHVEHVEFEGEQQDEQEREHQAK
jgi:hypothetical protein